MSRTRSLRLAAVALTAAAALTLAGCGDGTGTKTSGKADTSGADRTADDQGQQSTDDSRTSQTTDSDGKPADGSGKDAAAPSGKDAVKADKNGKVPCAPGAVKVEAKAVSSPVNHLLLVATNTSKGPCHAYGFPFLRFDADQATAISVEESRPQAVVTLAPGKSAYAGVLTSSADGSGGTVRKARKLSVSFQGPGGEQGAGGRLEVAAPRGTVAVDDSAKVTYWQDDSATALKW
ncbi:DUF4232 domain-containing protein [Streptomyces sp. ISL-11]|uniref:DUF4232 domain-containing protein n=1 Tax=Streptomyces sp. ISL-11 TaxID=2819174 RepID=UPI001BE50504|nr:DUF4232 domain-containing protein [Streptomyces sp. ISL-11]MBT2384841.1 DUF4232 domain-containing protein [Streptomyces sp. ISL-11]